MARTIAPCVLCLLAFTGPPAPAQSTQPGRPPGPDVVPTTNPVVDQHGPTIKEAYSVGPAGRGAGGPAAWATGPLAGVPQDVGRGALRAEGLARRVPTDRDAAERRRAAMGAV